MRRNAHWSVLLVATCLLAGCGGGSSVLPAASPNLSGTTSSSSATVTVSPSTVSVSSGAAQAFTATVSGSTNGAVTWSVQEGASGGSISGTGVFVACQTPGTYHVVATSVADPSKSAVAVVIVSLPSAIVVNISPSSVTLNPGATEPFTASVTGLANTAVTWSVAEGTPGGSFSTTGNDTTLFVASQTPGTYHVVAASVADPSKGAVAVVTVSAPGAAVVTISPSSVTLNAGATQQFIAPVTGPANTAVSWSVQEGAAGGFISSTGIYITPQNAAGTYHLVATSVADPSKTAVAVVTVSAPGAIGVFVSPTTATVLEGDSQGFSAQVNGTMNTAVTWEILEGPAGGTITPAGAYTAPVIATGGTFHVIAISAANGTSLGYATVTVPPVSVAITPSGSVQVFATASRQFSAVVNGSTDQRVTWSVAQGSTGGAISDSGLYTAPNNPGTYSIWASSVAVGGSTGVQVIVPDVSLQISPMADVLLKGSTRQFSATATPQDAVSWTTNDPNGTIDSTGLYTAGSAPGTYHVTAKPDFYPAKAVEATVTVTDRGFRYTAQPMSERHGGGSATLLNCSALGITGCGSLDGKVLVAGGFHWDPNDWYEVPDLDLEAYDPNTDGFSVVGTMPGMRIFHGVALLNTGKVLLAGGWTGGDGWGETASSDVYDLAKQTVTAGATMAVARVYPTVTVLASGSVLVTGGYPTYNGADCYDPTTTAEVYDPTLGSFTITNGPMNVARDGYTATRLLDGRVLIVGGANGYCGNGAWWASAEIYDPASGQLTLTKGSMATARAFHTSVLLSDGRVLVLGGIDASGNPVDTAEIYYPATDQFTSGGKLLVARFMHSASLLGDGKVLVAGGRTDNYVQVDGLYGQGDNSMPWGEIIQDAELFDPAVGTSTVTGSLREARYGHHATVLNDGTTVLVTGGWRVWSWLQPQYTAEIYK